MALHIKSKLHKKSKLLFNYNLVYIFTLDKVNMNLGTLGLLGLLQVGSPQDTSLQNSIRELMDSVGPAVYRQGTSMSLYLFSAQNQTEGDLFDCKVLFRGEEEQTSLAVGLCERSSESGEKRTATIISARSDSAGVVQERIIIDSGRNYSANVCYQNSISVRDRTINVQFSNLNECQSVYYKSLINFESYKKGNGPRGI